MAIKQLTLGHLKDLDSGKVSVAFQQMVERAVADCTDRPTESKARTVTLTFSVAPCLEDDGTCDRTEGQFQISAKLPNLKTKPYSFAIRKQGGASTLVFSEHSPENVDQATIFDDE